MAINDYVAMAIDMVAADNDRDKMFEAIDNMWHGEWELPAALQHKSDMREAIDLSPHDALKSGVAILSTSMPHWEIQPMQDNEQERDRVKDYAYAIAFNFRRMNQRGKSSVLSDMVMSCLRYDSVAVWLDYLPYQFKGKTLTLRQKHALRDGDFAALVKNPRTVHIQDDAYGPNTVLLTENVTAKEVISKWGARAIDLQTAMEGMKDTGVQRVVYNELMLYEKDQIKRVIWCSMAGNDTLTTGQQNAEFVIMDKPIDTPFMPWIVAVGGSNLESEPEYSVHPMLGSLYKTHKWEDLNSYQSILQSEIIKYGRSPRIKTTTPSGDGVTIDYEDGTTVTLRNGETAEPFQPTPIDPNISGLVDRVRAEVSSTTLPRILQNPEFAGNTPFASINAMIQTALGGLNPSKTLCEGALQEVGLKMLEWLQFDKKPLLAYRNNNIVTEGKGAGSFINIPFDEIDPESIQITCNLTASAPTDFNQRVQAAVQQNQQLHIPLAVLNAELGRENPESLFEQWAQEQYDLSTIQQDIQLTGAQQQQQLQIEGQQAAQQMQQEQQQNQAVGNQTMDSTGMNQPGSGMDSNVGAGVQNVPGQVTNPPGAAAGNPGAGSRELASGQDRTGAAIASIPQ
jgi:hypothetical protein